MTNALGSRNANWRIGSRRQQGTGCSDDVVVELGVAHERAAFHPFRFLPRHSCPLPQSSFIPTNRDRHGTAIPRPHRFVSLEASIRECMVNSSPLEHPVFGIHSVGEFRRCRQHRLLPGPKLSVVQPVLFRSADRASANIEVHPINKFEFRLSRKSV